MGSVRIEPRVSGGDKAQALQALASFQIPSRLTKKFPANFTESICEIMYKLDTRADCRMMGMLEV